MSGNASSREASRASKWVNTGGESADNLDMSLFARPRSNAPDIPGSPERLRSSLEAALRVSELAASAAALPEAIQGMLAVALDLLGAEQGSIMLVDDAGAGLVLAASCGLPTEVPLGSTLGIGEGVAGRVLATGRPMRLGEIDGSTFVNFVPKDRRISSSVVVPLRVQGRGIGVLNLAMAAGSPPFSDEDLRVAQMFADQTAGLIYRARLHERAEHRSADLTALVESSRGLVGTLDLDALLQRILDGGVRLCGTRDGFACMFDNETGAIGRGVFRGFDKATISSLLRGDEVGRAVADADVVVFESPGHGLLTALGLRTSRATKAVLVAAADEVVASDRTHLLRAFGQQCATALGAAELHAEVERKETELSAVIQGVPNPIALIDPHNRIVALNPAAEDLFGVSSVFGSGSPVEGAFGNREFESLLVSEGEVQGEIVAGNPVRTYKVRVTDVRVPGGLIGRVGILDDITTEREIVRMQRDFAAMIGHELRTPLTIVKGFARTILKRADRATPEQLRDAVSTIDAKAAQLERLIDDLLYVSKIEAREATLKVTAVEIAPLIKSISDEVLRDHRGREIHVDAAAVPTWPCDETKLALVLRHLIDNGLKYSEGPEVVLVRAYEDDDGLRIDVVDRGVGIISSDVPHIFDRFKQVDNSSTRRHGGTGVGLYLCSQLVRIHGGRIAVDSIWGKGSTFTVTIPRATGSGRVVTLRSSESLTA